MAQIGYNLDGYYYQQSLTRINQLSSSVKIRKDGESNGEGGELDNSNDKDDDDDGSSIIQPEFVYQLAFFFHSLSSSSSSSSGANVAAAVAIDPTDFYLYLSSSNYNATAAAAINTDDVGDAAIVFRCLISMLEHSVQKEVQRLYQQEYTQ